MKQHLLVVDDESETRALLTAYFQKEGYEVSSVGSAGEALSGVRRWGCDVVLLDLLLPDGDGLGTLERLKAQRPELPVIIITGMGTDEGLLQEALGCGASGYVSKTAPLDQLLMEVKRSMKGKEK